MVLGAVMLSRNWHTIKTFRSLNIFVCEMTCKSSLSHEGEYLNLALNLLLNLAQLRRGGGIPENY